jgi:hypothetical protein
MSMPDSLWRTAPYRRVVIAVAGLGLLAIVVSTLRLLGDESSPHADPPKPPATVEPPAVAGSETEPATGFSLDSDPTRAMLELDGRIVGLTPLRLENVSPGQHLIRLYATGRMRWETAILITRGVVHELPTARLPRDEARAALATHAPWTGAHPAKDLWVSLLAPRMPPISVYATGQVSAHSRGQIGSWTCTREVGSEVVRRFGETGFLAEFLRARTHAWPPDESPPPESNSITVQAHGRREHAVWGGDAWPFLDRLAGEIRELAAGTYGWAEPVAALRAVRTKLERCAWGHGAGSFGVHFNIDRHTGLLTNLGVRAPSPDDYPCLFSAARSVRFEPLPTASCDPEWFIMVVRHGTKPIRR